MSDELKDFRYYADKAEAWLETTWKESPGNDIGHSIDKATVYAELAKAAPKAGNGTKEGLCDSRYQWAGVTYLCILRTEDHPKRHFNGADGIAWRDEEAGMPSEAGN